MRGCILFLSCICAFESLAYSAGVPGGEDVSREVREADNLKSLWCLYTWYQGTSNMWPAVCRQTEQFVQRAVHSNTYVASSKDLHNMRLFFDNRACLRNFVKSAYFRKHKAHYAAWVINMLRLSHKMVQDERKLDYQGFLDRYGETLGTLTPENLKRFIDGGLFDQIAVTMIELLENQSSL